MLKFIRVCVRNSGSGLDKFCELEISGRPRGVMEAHDRGVQQGSSTGACDKGV